MPRADCHAIYWAGIAVTAMKYGIKLERLSVGDQFGLDGEAKLERLESWVDSNVGVNPFKAARVECYVTTLLAGSAASFIQDEDRRCNLKRSLGSVGLESMFLRQMWQCLQREPDRAIAIIFGSLGDLDDGDVEATTRRLWHRAVQVLRHPVHCQQLKRLAAALVTRRQMTGSDVARHLGRV